MAIVKHPEVKITLLGIDRAKADLERIMESAKSAEADLLEMKQLRFSDVDNTTMRVDLGVRRGNRRS